MKKFIIILLTMLIAVSCTPDYITPVPHYAGTPKDFSGKWKSDEVDWILKFNNKSLQLKVRNTDSTFYRGTSQDVQRVQPNEFYLIWADFNETFGYVEAVPMVETPGLFGNIGFDIRDIALDTLTISRSSWEKPYTFYRK